MERTPGGFKIVAADGTSIAFVYAEETPLVGTQAKLDLETGRRVAANIARLPELLRKPEP